MDDQSAAQQKKASNFTFDVLKLASGTTIAQALNILAAPLLTRLYSPEAFGVLALFTSITAIVAVLVCLRYESTILLPQRDEDAANLFVGSFLISVGVSLLTIPAVWWLGPSIGVFLNSPELVPFLWLLPPVVFFGGITAGHPILHAWASRRRDFSQIAITRVISNTARVSTSLVAGFAGLYSAGLILGGLASSILSPLWLGYQIWRKDRHFLLSHIRWSSIWAGLVRYWKFPFYDFPAVLLNTISWHIPSFMLSAIFSTSVVGYYALGDQLLRVPMNLIGMSIGQAFYPHAVAAHREGRLGGFVEDTFRRLVEYSCFPILILIVIGRDLFLVVFGSEWTEAGIYTQILSIWMLFWFISSPMHHLFNVLEKNELALGLNVVILLTRIGSIWLGGILHNPYYSLLFYSLSGAMVYGYTSMLIVSLAGTAWSSIVRILLVNLFLASCAIVAILTLRLFHVQTVYQLIVATVLVVAYYLYRFRSSLFSIMIGV